MSNPARDLLGIFDSWRTEQPAGESRGLDKGGHEGVEQHLEAMKLIRDIHAALASLLVQGRDVAIFYEASDSWVKMVLAYPHGWGKSRAESATLYNEARTDILEALTVLLDGMPVQVNEAQVANLGTYLDSVQDLLEADDALDDALRKYLFDLIAEVRRASDEYRVTGHFEASDALTHLWVSLLAATQQSKSHKSKWKNFASALKVPVTSGILINLPTLAIEALKLASQ